MPKQVNGVWLPDREEHLVNDVLASPMFAGAGSVQFKKYAACIPYIRQFRHAVDIGANCGIWTRVMARCFPLVTAFEPSAEAIECFWLNNPWREMDDRSQIILKAYALGAEPGTIKLNTKLRSSGFTRADPEGDAEVEIRTLDSFDLPQVDFIKIDVEGFEHPVVKGAVETIRKYRPLLIVEQKPDNAERHGFKQYGAVNLLKKMGANQIADISGDVIMQFPK
jgi:FkbM family methyltransferase